MSKKIIVGEQEGEVPIDYDSTKHDIVIGEDGSFSVQNNA
jgi:hypothetical protein